MLPSLRRAGWLSAGLPLFTLSILLAPRGRDTCPGAKPIVIGVSVPLSGPDSSAGEEDRDAVLTGVNRWKERNGDTINGHEIVVHAEDDGCTEADITVQAAQRRRG